MRAESGRLAECQIAPVGRGDYQLTVFYNGLPVTTEMYSTVLQARGRAKHLAAVLRASGWYAGPDAGVAPGPRAEPAG